MKILLPVFLCAILIVSCTNPNNSDDNAFSKDNWITLEGTAVKDTTNTALQSWYNGAYLTKMMEYAGLKGAYRFKNIGGPFGIDFVPAYFTNFMSETKDELLGMPNSSQAIQANSDMATKWPDSQIVRKWNVSYEKLKSWENESAKNPMLYVTVVGLQSKTGYETAVNDWEINKHVPWLMKYKGLSRTVRYKKVDGTGANVSQMPNYIELFYYSDKAGFDGQNSDTNFVAANADLQNTWKNGELEITFVLNGQTIQEVKK